MDDQFAATKGIPPTATIMSSTSGLFGHKDAKSISVTSRLVGKKSYGRGGDVAMRARSDDQMEQSTSQNKPGFNWINFGK